MPQINATRLDVLRIDTDLKSLQAAITAHLLSAYKLTHPMKDSNSVNPAFIRTHPLMTAVTVLAESIEMVFSDKVLVGDEKNRDAANSDLSFIKRHGHPHSPKS